MQTATMNNGALETDTHWEGEGAEASFQSPPRAPERHPPAGCSQAAFLASYQKVSVATDKGREGGAWRC